MMETNGLNKLEVEFILENAAKLVEISMKSKEGDEAAKIVRNMIPQ